MELERSAFPNIDILKLILSDFCDAKSLATMWQVLLPASPTSSKHRDAVFSTFAKVIEARLRGLPASRARDTLLPSVAADARNVNRGGDGGGGGWSSVKAMTRDVSLRISALEYCRVAPTVLWCGSLGFGHFDGPPSIVTLRSEEIDGCWNLRDMHTWQSAFPEGMTLKLQPYNFVPVLPRGRLHGIDKRDIQKVGWIRRRLEHNNDVATLRFGNRSLILRIISPEQAERRLNPYPALQRSFRSFPDGLLCCWEHRRDPDIKRSSAEDLEMVDRVIRKHNELKR